MEPAHIDWHYSGRPDALCGTQATRAERLLAYGFAVAVTVALISYYHWIESPIGQGWRQWVMAVLVFDVAGGVVANMVNACKRFYHAPLQPGEAGLAALAKRPMVFALFHVHPVLVAVMYDGDILVGVAWYVALLAGVAGVLAIPLYLRRPAAAAIVVGALLISLYGPALADGAEWLIPCLFLKIVLAHAVREEPYRPSA